MVDPSKPIRRSKRDAMLGGVCAGLAHWAGWDPSVARVLCILVTAFTGFALGIVAYAVLWVFLPADTQALAPASRAVAPPSEAQP